MMLGGASLDAKLGAFGRDILQYTLRLAPLWRYFPSGPLGPDCSASRARRWRALVYGVYGSRWGCYNLDSVGRPVEVRGLSPLVAQSPLAAQSPVVSQSPIPVEHSTPLQPPRIERRTGQPAWRR